jgi:CheY-like chemotaxis protein
MPSGDTRARISVVNDNPDFLELMSEILREESTYEVTLFNGNEGFPIDDLRLSKPDLVIVDLLLGGLSGWEIVTLSRADPELSHVPIIICSGDVAQLRERKDELARIGNIHILAKPFGIDELTQMVSDTLVRESDAATAAAS